ncbi:MAG TPA: prepilin-type N-terminal cleavage/methylation domain-containing protein [Oceanospirillales bacterium]|nr:prepilin-type N-terminal cleavage/methylation domain-containing protein [Oceanospirillales bacterium]
MALKKWHKGMTLLEVLIAMTLMVVVSGIAYAALNGLINAKIHTDEVADNYRLQVLFSRQLSKDIHAIIPRTVKNEFGKQVPAILGSYSNISFSRNGQSNPFLKKRSDLQRIRWFIQDNKIYRESIDYLDVGSLPKWQKRTYLDNIDELSFTYIASTGIESRNWPINNGVTIGLRFIRVFVKFKDKTRLQFNLRVGF